MPAFLIEQMSEAWAAATRHPFLEAVGDGTTEAFDLWLAQDALFVTDLVTFQARLVARAPRSAQRVLADGVVGMLAELDWFDGQSTTLAVDRDVEPLPATLEYRRLLERMDGQPYPAAVVGLWALEQVYLEAWRYAGSCNSDPRYAAAIEHWTDPEFARYVARLEEAADDAVVQDRGRAADTVRDVLAREIAFWDMAWRRPG
jgi:formylaminopyrimidine deformylase / aminopyrimidine aminohydrolase